MNAEEFFGKAIREGELDFKRVVFKEGTDFTPYVEEWNNYLALHSFGLQRYPLELNEACLSKIIATGIDFSYCIFNEANLPHSNFSFAKITNAQFISANLENINLSDANLLNTNFVSANLENSNLRNSNFYGSTLMGAKFTKADASYANFGFADFKNTSLSKTDFSDANLKGAENLEKAIGLGSALFNINTKVTAEEKRLIFKAVKKQIKSIPIKGY